MGSFPETYINPLFLDQFKAWIYRKLVSGKVRKILFSVVKREYSALVLSWCVAVTIFWGPFLESLDHFSGPKSAFVFTVFAWDQSFNNLKMTQWNYQLTKQNWPVCERGTLLLFNCFWFRNLPSDPRSCRDFRETGPCIVCFEAVEWGRFKQSITLNERTLKELYFNYNLFK